MPNPFDQFDTPLAMRMPDNPGMQANPFDQFDAEPAPPMAWSDVAKQAVQNIPSSAYGVASSIANTVMHPIDTAEGLYDVGRGAVSKGESALGFDQDPAVKAEREQALNGVLSFFKDRYGGLENFKKTLAEDPAGVAMDLSTILTGGETALARLPGTVGRAGEVAGQASRITNPVRIAGKTARAVGDNVIAPIVGKTTGAGAMPIRQAARAGFEGNRVFLDNMRGIAPMSDTVDMAQSAVRQMGRERGAAYKANMAKAKAAPGHVGYQPIYDALSDADKMVNFQGLARSDDALKTLQDIKDKVAQWRSIPVQHAPGPNGTQVLVSSPYSVEAADALKQAIGEIRQSTKPGTLSRKVADSVYNAAKRSIVQQAPEYAKAMKDYANASEILDELTRTFSLGEKAAKDTTLRKLQSVTRNNVNTNYGQRAKLMDDLARFEPNLPHAVSGQALSSATPRGLSGLAALNLGSVGGGYAAATGMINPALLAALPFFSPRLVGETAYAGGRGLGMMGGIPGVLPEAAKAGYIADLLH